MIIAMPRSARGRGRERRPPPSAHAGTWPWFTFSHPDCTVGPGVPPSHAVAGSRALPPIRNWRDRASPCPEGVFSCYSIV